MQYNDNSSSHSSEYYDLQIKDTIPYYEFYDETINDKNNIKRG